PSGPRHRLCCHRLVRMGPGRIDDGGELCAGRARTRSRPPSGQAHHPRRGQRTPAPMADGGPGHTILTASPGRGDVPRRGTRLSDRRPGTAGRFAKAGITCENSALNQSLQYGRTMRAPPTVRGPLDLGLSAVRMNGEVPTLAKGDDEPRVDKQSTTVTEKSEGTAGTASPGGSKTTAASKSTAKKTAKTSSTAGTKKAAASKSAKSAAKATAAKTTTAASKKTTAAKKTTASKTAESATTKPTAAKEAKKAAKAKKTV